MGPNGLGSLRPRLLRPPLCGASLKHLPLSLRKKWFRDRDEKSLQAFLQSAAVDLGFCGFRIHKQRLCKLLSGSC